MTFLLKNGYGLLQNAVKVKFIPDSSDKNEYGIKTAAYFCLDGITLIEK